MESKVQGTTLPFLRVLGGGFKDFWGYFGEFEAIFQYFTLLHNNFPLFHAIKRYITSFFVI